MSTYGSVERPTRAAVAALAELRQQRRDAGIVPEYEPARPDRFRSMPGFDVEGVLQDRSPRGQLRRLHGWPYLWDPRTGKTDARCAAFLERWRALWGAGSDVAFVHELTERDDMGGAHCVFGQTYRGVPVDRLQIVVHLDPKGRVTGFNGEPVVRLAEPPPATFDATQAGSIAQAANPALSPQEPELVVFAPAELNDHALAEARLAWKVARTDARGELVDHAWIDGRTGEILASDPIERDMTQEVWDAGGQEVIGGTLRYRNSPYYYDSCTGHCSEAVWNQATVAYQWQSTFGRDSYDGNGSRMKTVYNYGSGACSNAHAKGGGQIATSVNLTDLDVIAHEFGHELERSEMGVGPYGEAAARSEHIGDLDDMWIEGATLNQDWKLEGACFPGSDPIRRYNDPPADAREKDPDSWRWYEETTNDDYNSHTDAGILNKLAYLVLSDGSHTFHDVTVDGLGFDDGRRIFYDAINLRYYSSYAGFHDYRDGLVAACASRYGPSSNQCKQLDNAWNAVGLWSPRHTVSASIHSRPAAHSWAINFLGTQVNYLFVFYRSSSPNSPYDIKWRLVDTESGYWGDEYTVTLGGVAPQTDRPVAVAPYEDSSTGQRYLYVYYREVGTASIKYFRITPGLVFEGPWTIPPALAVTDQAPAAATTGGITLVMFKDPLSNDVKMVRQQNLGPWQAVTPPPFTGTDTGPYLVDWDSWLFVAAVKRPDFEMEYAVSWGGTSWIHWPGDGNSSQSGVGVVGGDNFGNREYDQGPWTQWYWEDALTNHVPTIAPWKGGLVVVSDVYSMIFMQTLATPRFQGELAWSGRAQQPDYTPDSPLVVPTKNLLGDEESLWFITRASDYEIDWRESRGGQ